MLNLISRYYRRIFPKRDALVIRTKNRLDKINPSAGLSEDEHNRVIAYYQQFGFLKINDVFHTFYKTIGGKFDVRYLPETIYYRYIDRYYNNWDMAKYVDNKTLYCRLFHEVNQPNTIVKRMNGFWLDKSNKITNVENVKSLLNNREGFFCKIANESYGGKGVLFCKSIQDFEEFISQTSKDIIIQEPLTQHALLNKINPSSINTLRFISLLKLGGGGENIFNDSTHGNR